MFPEFLLPSIVFRSRRQNADCPPPMLIPSSQKTRGNKYLTSHVSRLCCSSCGADLCLKSQVISKGFTGRHGRAYLVSGEPAGSAVSMKGSSSPSDSLPNTVLRKPFLRELVTGLHTISDIACAWCGSLLGWKYVAAEEESQHYKVGKFILETRRIYTSSMWESLVGADQTASPASLNPAQTKLTVDGDEGQVEFDSEDEDECDDIFAGIWSPGLAKRRRDQKLGRRPSMFGLSS